MESLKLKVVVVLFLEFVLIVATPLTVKHELGIINISDIHRFSLLFVIQLFWLLRRQVLARGHLRRVEITDIPFIARVIVMD